MASEALKPPSPGRDRQAQVTEKWRVEGGGGGRWEERRGGGERWAVRMRSVRVTRCIDVRET